MDGEVIGPTFIPYIGGGYYEYPSDPINKDTDGDFCLDRDEKSGEITQYNFSQHLGVLFSKLVYENIEDYVKGAGP